MILIRCCFLCVCVRVSLSGFGSLCVCVFYGVVSFCPVCVFVRVFFVFPFFWVCCLQCLCLNLCLRSLNPFVVSVLLLMCVCFATCCFGSLCTFDPFLCVWSFLFFPTSLYIYVFVVSCLLTCSFWHVPFVWICLLVFSFLFDFVVL